MVTAQGAQPPHVTMEMVTQALRMLPLSALMDLDSEFSI